MLENNQTLENSNYKQLSADIQISEEYKVLSTSAKKDRAPTEDAKKFLFLYKWVLSYFLRSQQILFRIVNQEANEHLAKEEEFCFQQIIFIANNNEQELHKLAKYVVGMASVLRTVYQKPQRSDSYWKLQ